jgi:hypothetical protein
MTPEDKDRYVCPDDAGCGTNSRYAHGCRGDACGVARLIYQRNKRKTKNPGPSKYHVEPPPAPQAVVDQLKNRLKLRQLG